MSKSPHRHAFRVAIIASLALFFAQWGALAHAYSHGLEATQTAAQHESPNSHEYCSDCLNFAPLLASAAAPTPLPFVLPHLNGLAARIAHTCQDGHPTRLAFRSRAPPTR